MPKPEKQFEPNKKVMKAISVVIREERNKQNLSQEELAEKAGLTWRHFNRFETGRLNPSVSSFVSVANALSIRAGELLDKVMDEAGKLEEQVE